ncbi:hypothetical protein JCM10213_009116 [Rhodosporidiobolus nylandii]
MPNDHRELLYARRAAQTRRTRRADIYRSLHKEEHREEDSSDSSAEEDGPLTPPAGKGVSTGALLFLITSAGESEDATSYTASPSSTSLSSPSSSSSAQSALEALGIGTFLGNNSGAIASWYSTDQASDDTNGTHSGEADDDTVPGFAPALDTMLKSFKNDAAAAKTAFCGLEADVYSPATGTTTTLILADAFDPKWVRTPASIDVIRGSFPKLFGRSTDDKNDVAKECWWVLTGARDNRQAGRVERTREKPLC